MYWKVYWVWLIEILQKNGYIKLHYYIIASKEKIQKLKVLKNTNKFIYNFKYVNYEAENWNFLWRHFYYYQYHYRNFKPPFRENSLQATSRDWQWTCYFDFEQIFGLRVPGTTSRNSHSRGHLNMLKNQNRYFFQNALNRMWRISIFLKTIHISEMCNSTEFIVYNYLTIVKRLNGFLKVGDFFKLSRILFYTVFVTCP